MDTICSPSGINPFTAAAAMLGRLLDPAYCSPDTAAAPGWVRFLAAMCGTLGFVLVLALFLTAGLAAAVTTIYLIVVLRDVDGSTAAPQTRDVAWVAGTLTVFAGYCLAPKIAALIVLGASGWAWLAWWMVRDLWDHGRFPLRYSRLGYWVQRRRLARDWRRARPDRHIPRIGVRR